LRARDWVIVIAAVLVLLAATGGIPGK